MISEFLIDDLKKEMGPMATIQSLPVIASAAKPSGVRSPTGTGTPDCFAALAMTNHQSAISNHKCFTLIELLVVVAVIAVLVALLLPALSAARDQAKLVACQAQLKQFALGVQMYLDDYGNILPTPYPDPQINSVNWPNYWFRCLIPRYVICERADRPTVLFCPAEPNRSGAFWGVTYSMNMVAMGRSTNGEKLNSWGQPKEKVIVFFDSQPSCPSYNLWNGWNAELQLERGRRHRGGENVIFGDLRITWMNDLHWPPNTPDYAWE